MQNQITKPTLLLGNDGNIIQPGYCKSMLYEYNREAITARKSRIKEWDYYYISNDNYALCLTIADMGYVGGLSISVMDFVQPDQLTNSSVFFFPMGKLNMPRTSTVGDCQWQNGKVKMSFANDGMTRRLVGVYPNADKKGMDIKWDIVIDDVPKESMVIATPFDKKGYFYLNQKINCMRAEGWFSLGEEVKTFDKKDSLATLDWGRGVWTYDNTWYWSSLHSILKDGKTFGWNLGYGFGNTQAASEDMLFYDGRAHKVGRSKFIIAGEEDGKPRFMEDWKIITDDGRVDCVFKPIIDRQSPLDLKVMCMIPHQVFGRLYGKCVLDDGQIIQLDGELGFAEKVHNKW